MVFMHCLFTVLRNHIVVGGHVEFTIDNNKKLIVKVVVLPQYTPKKNAQEVISHKLYSLTNICMVETARKSFVNVCMKSE